MAVYSKFLSSAILATTLAATTHAEDANPEPEQHVTVQATQSTAAVRRQDTISEAAAVYGTFQHDVSDVRNKPLSSASDIDTALENLGGHNAGKLSTGWLAYSALVASQNPEFRDAVRDIEGFYGRDRVMTGLRNDMGYARTLGGAGSAISSALTATEADSKRLSSAAAYVKEQAYTLQGTGWAKARISDANGMAAQLNNANRLGRATNSNVMQALHSPTIDTALVQAGGGGAPSLWDGAIDAASGIQFPSLRRPSLTVQQQNIRRGKEQIADRIATLAAYRVIGIDNRTAGQLSTAMSDTETSSCIRRSQLNLQQCVAASYKQYELPYCLSEHALQDVGECIGDVTN
ncbi:MAG: hypothetical protein AAGK23_00265 [Pseudomonadota bacterium]